MRTLHDRFKRVTVLNCDWTSALTPSALQHPNDPEPSVAVFLDPPYRTTGRRDSILYKSDADGTSDEVATSAYEWAVENGDRYRKTSRRRKSINTPPSCNGSAQCRRQIGARFVPSVERAPGAAPSVSTTSSITDGSSTAITPRGGTVHFPDGGWRRRQLLGSRGWTPPVSHPATPQHRDWPAGRPGGYKRAEEQDGRVPAKMPFRRL